VGITWARGAVGGTDIGIAIRRHPAAKRNRLAWCVRAGAFASPRLMLRVGQMHVETVPREALRNTVFEPHCDQSRYMPYDAEGNAVCGHYEARRCSHAFVT